MDKLSMNELAKYIDEWCDRKGWNQNLQLGNAISNCHSELSEAWEELRAGHLVDYVYEEEGKPGGFPIELADTIIRILHLCAHYNIDIEEVIRRKMEYNESRPFRHGGKTA